MLFESTHWIWLDLVFKCLMERFVRAILYQSFHLCKDNIELAIDAIKVLTYFFRSQEPHASGWEERVRLHESNHEMVMLLHVSRGLLLEAPKLNLSHIFISFVRTIQVKSVSLSTHARIETLE